MLKTYKVLSALLEYPTAALVEAIPELAQVLEDEGGLPGRALTGLGRLLAEIEREDLFDLQERYVSLFDRVRSLSLHLFEHVHGESRDRGQALVDLKQLYERHGFAFATSELPDYLPAFLEFLSQIDSNEAKDLLAETAHVLEGIAARLAKRASPYAAVFEALLALVGRAVPQAAAIADDDIRKEDDPATLDALWEEQPAFGPAPECGAAVRSDVSVVRFHERAA